MKDVEVRAVEGGVWLSVNQGDADCASVTLTVAQARGLGNALLQAAEVPERRLMFSALQRLWKEAPNE